MCCDNSTLGPHTVQYISIAAVKYYTKPRAWSRDHMKPSKDYMKPSHIYYPLILSHHGAHCILIHIHQLTLTTLSNQWSLIYMQVAATPSAICVTHHTWQII